nr:hypothetical protein [Tanacetum cinerariifolium]
MTTLADKAILSGANNRPPMLEKDMYDSWKSIMKLYMMNRKHGQMNLESVENGPLIWSSIEENRVTRPKKYSELSATEAIQADCDVKETNIILQGQPSELTNTKKQLEFPSLDLGLIVLMFKQGDNPIDAINHIMSFLSAVVTFRYPTTNNQLRNSSNPMQQAIINDDSITLQPVQGRQISFSLGTSKTYTSGTSESNSGKQRTIIVYNCKGEGHMSKQCTKPKRKRDDLWFKDKVLLVQAQANGQILHEEELAFLADPEITEVNCAKINLDNKTVNDTLTGELERYKEQVKVLKEGQHVALKNALKDALRKLKGKTLADDDVTSHFIDPKMLNVDVEPINPRLLNNRSAHSDYLKHTQKEAAIHREIVEQGNHKTL